MSALCFTIFGSGFGLYGYLPAVLARSEHSVVLPERYKDVVLGRSELRHYHQRITWVPSISDALCLCNCAIISVTPEKQKHIVDNVLSFDGINKILIEKPICPTPVEAEILLDKLIGTGASIRVGYIFLYTDWYDIVKNYIEENKKITISWAFKAHHFFHNKYPWKRFHSKGGGVLRFYGIHILSVLASLGYQTVLESFTVEKNHDQPDTWRATFKGNNLPPCEIILATDSCAEIFEISMETDTNTIASLHCSTSPVDQNRGSRRDDGRVPHLVRLLHSFEHGDELHIELYRATNILWRQVEANNVKQRFL